LNTTADRENVWNKTVTEYNYTVIFERAPEGDYNVVVPAIPEICTFGETLDEAREMARDAIRCVLESARETGEAIPRAIVAN
jgi:predicted RNase H-like HicB family nuclease